MEIKNINDCKVVVSAPTNTNYLDLFKCSNIFCIIAMINSKVTEGQKREMDKEQKKYLAEVFMKDVMKLIEKRNSDNFITDHYRLEALLQKLFKEEGRYDKTIDISLAFDKFKSMYDKLRSLDKQFDKINKKYAKDNGSYQLNKEEIKECQKHMADLWKKVKSAPTLVEKAYYLAQLGIAAERYAALQVLKIHWESKVGPEFQELMSFKGKWAEVTKMPIDGLQGKFSDLSEEDRVTLNGLQNVWFSMIEQLVEKGKKN